MPPTKILLVDDDQALVKALKDRLSIRLFRVYIASNGRDGLIKLYEDPEVDVVLLDAKMPTMDGIETLREMKKVYPLVEVIMLADEATIARAVEGMKLGAFDYIMKPFDIDEVLTKVEEARYRRRKHRDKIKAAENLVRSNQ